MATSSIGSIGGTVSFGGLSSGLDTKSIVEQLVSLKETQLIGPIDKRITQIKAQREALLPIQSALLKLSQAAKKLKNTDNVAWNVKSGVSSDTDSVTISSTNSTTAVKGTYTVSTVSQLAQADRVVFNHIANKTTTQLGTGTIGITYKGATTNVAITSTNNTLTGIAAAINNANAGVTASIINDGDGTTPYRLVLTSVATGSDTTITPTLSGTLAAALTVDAVTSATAANEPLSAIFTLNGLASTSKSNIVTDAIDGVTFNLLKINTTTTTTLTVKQDSSVIAQSITDFVTAYQEMYNLLQKTIQPDSSTSKFGPLGNDLTMSTAAGKISEVMVFKMKSLAGYQYSSLSQIGITADNKGDLQVDAAKLTTSLDAYSTDVRLLFQGSSSEDGIAKRMYTYVDTLTNGAGILTKKDVAYKNNLTRLATQLKERTRTVDLYHQRLFDRFNHLELVLAGLKNQQGQLDAFTGYNNNNN